ncbi:MAG: hypothetical protein KatS3mg105_4410 [Gemmatales bacterium]|nr:MAG: hypothetical protein KatS3mg105_4410 [Gemmatales bacterium]
MASVSLQPSGRRKIQFLAPDGKRKTIYLGKCDKRTAEAICRHVEGLLAAKIAGQSIPRETAAWLAGVGDGLREKLARVGLIDPASTSRAVMLDSFIAEFMDSRTDVKPGTTICWRTARRRLARFFGDRPISSITPADADKFAAWLRTHYAQATAGRCIKHAKTFFRAAVRSRLIEANPFEDVKPPSQTNDARKHYVDADTIHRILEACPDHEWRLIIALSRFAGLRCPSEVLALRWEDVNWEKNRFLVRSEKTEHHAGKGTRWVPIFPELMPFLADAFDKAKPGAVHVITRYRDAKQNLRTQFQRIIYRAGVDAWPKLFHNLRASCETDLASRFPIHVVCSWIGNSTLIAQKHYLQVTEADFQSATQKTTQQHAENNDLVLQGVPGENQEMAYFPGFATKYNTLRILKVGTEGLEPPAPSV